MRSFLITSVVFVLVVAIMCCGISLITGICNHMEEHVKALPDQAQDSPQLQILTDYWNEWRPRLRFLVRRTELNNISDLLRVLGGSAAPEVQDTCAYQLARELLLSAIEEIRRGEQLAWR